METKNPPPRARNGGRPVAWQEQAETIKERAERDDSWSVLATNASNPSLARNVRYGALTAFRPAGAFEATARKNEDGTYMIYARYTGKEE